MRVTLTCCVTALLLVPPAAAAQNPMPSGRAYTDGPVMEVTYVRTKPGMFDTYMRYLQTTYKTQREAEKAAGIILDYAILTSPTRTPQDHDLMLVVRYRNWAALDNLTQRTDSVANRVTRTTPEQRDQASIDRGAMRELLGSRQYQELRLK